MKYTKDFKRNAVALVTEQAYKVSEGVRSLGFYDNLLRPCKGEWTGNWLHRTQQEAIIDVREYMATY